LTPDQVKAYNQNGFVVIDPAFDESELQALRRAADDLLVQSGPVDPDNPRLQIEQEDLDGKMVVRKIEPVIDVVPALQNLVYDPRMTAPAARIFGEDVILFEDKLNYKPPFVGSKYDLHQDFAYWQAYSDRLITVTLLLDDATVENGCLRFVPGSHKNGLIPRKDDHPRIIQEVDDSSIAVDAPGPAGSLIVFSCYTAHHSFPNRTDTGRRAILYTYNPSSDGDTYPTYKGTHTQKCLDWLAEQNLHDRGETPFPSTVQSPPSTGSK
jgi:ectoine hydroxylase-related dioxygenase (phytanoyl-CoA dioxygenase family)